VGLIEPDFVTGDFMVDDSWAFLSDLDPVIAPLELEFISTAVFFDFGFIFGFEDFGPFFVGSSEFIDDIEKDILFIVVGYIS